MDKELIISQLNIICEKLLEENDYFENAINELNTMKIENLVSYYLYNKEGYDDDDKIIIQLIIRVLQIIYNNSGLISPICDEEYDKLYELNREVNDEEIVSAPISNASGKSIGHHKYPDLRGTLDKVHFIRKSEKGKDKRKSLEEWYQSVINRIGRPLTTEESTIYIFPKWDGISGIIECKKDGFTDKVLTRGDTDKNEALDLTPMFKDTKFDYEPRYKYSDYGVKTEIVMSEENYHKLCKIDGEYKSPRSAVSSIFNSKFLDKKYLQYLTVIPLQVQNYETKEITIAQESYDQYPYFVSKITNFNEISNIFIKLKKVISDDYGLPIDGAVIRLIDHNIQKLLGRKDRINLYEVAYKYPPEQKKTKIINIDFSVGLMGAITPVAKVEPVKIKGNTISSISLGSLGRLETLKLGPDDEVIIKYEIIPYLTTDDTCIKSSNDRFKYPTHCPYCGSELETNIVLRCLNQDCKCRKIGKIINYIDKMRISNIDTSTVTIFYKLGYLTKIEDLYTLDSHRDSIINLKGFGVKSFENIFNGIKYRNTIYDYELLGSIGIPDIGEKIFKNILNIYYIDELIDICIREDIDKLTNIGGVGHVMANKITKGIQNNLQLIEFLRKQLNVQQDRREYKLKVCFTKVRDKNFEKYLDKIGVLVLDSYNKQINLLIVPNLEVDSSKVEKAKKDKQKGAKIEIITIDDAYKIFGYNQQK